MDILKKYILLIYHTSKTKYIQMPAKSFKARLKKLSELLKKRAKLAASGRRRRRRKHKKILGLGKRRRRRRHKLMM